MFTRHLCCLLLVLLLFPLLTEAQPLQVWMNQYTNQSQTSYHMIQTSDGNYAHCVREGYSGDVLYLASPEGDEIWHRTYGEMGNYDGNYDVVELPGGGFAMAGFTWVDEQEAYDARLIITDESGFLVTETLVGDSTQSDNGRALVRTADGRIFMTGDTWTGERSEGALWEFNEAGDLVNSYTFSEGVYSVGFNSIDITSDNHLVMSGGGYFALNNYDGYVVKTDLDGNEVWGNVISLAFWQYMTIVREATDGSFMFAGNAALDEDGSPGYPWYGKLDANGDSVWVKHYPGSTSTSYFLTCTEDLDGNWLFGGRIEGEDPHQDALLLKVDPEDGSEIWTLLVGDSTAGSDEGFSDIHVLGDDSYILAGDGDFGELTYPAFLAWYNATGTGVERDRDIQLPDEFEIVRIYPNPFNPVTSISVGLPKAAFLQMNVYNVLGQKVDILTNKTLSAGYHSFTLDASDLSSGTYFIHASVPGKMNELRKVVLMK